MPIRKGIRKGNQEETFFRMSEVSPAASSLVETLKRR
jgi:hypothetical protein